MKDKYQKTVYACFVGYIVQAIVNNFVPLLFLTFEKKLPYSTEPDHNADHIQFRDPAAH